jgi:hypothetical protein
MLRIVNEAERRKWAPAEQPHPGFVDEGGRLQRVANLLVADAAGDAAQLAFEQREQAGAADRVGGVAQQLLRIRWRRWWDSIAGRERW